MAGVVVDAGVLIDLERGVRTAELWVKEAVERRDDLLVAGATYAEVWTGNKNNKGYQLNRVLKMVTPVPTTDVIGKRAGEILSLAGGETSLRFDAIVVATAAQYGAVVLTNDLDDIEYLGAYANVRVLSTNTA